MTTKKEDIISFMWWLHENEYYGYSYVDSDTNTIYYQKNNWGEHFKLEDLYDAYINELNKQ